MLSMIFKRKKYKRKRTYTLGLKNRYTLFILCFQKSCMAPNISVVI